MEKVIVVKTDMGEIQCNYYSSKQIEGFERINDSLRRMRELLESTYPRKELKELEYELYVYESEEINAFSVETESGYVIAFSTALFIQFYKKLRNLFLVEEICKWFGTSPTKAEDRINAIYDYMLWFIAFHEFFHVINGHCRCLSDIGIFNVEKIEETDVVHNLICQVVESDADYSAAIACVNYIFVVAMNDGAFDTNVNANIRNILIKAAVQEVIFLGFAVYHTFLLFSCGKKENVSNSINNLLKYNHPYPSIRMAYSMIAIAFQLGYFLPEDKIKGLMNTIMEICIAYDRIYYAEESFNKSLVSLAFTERGTQHIMLLHNSWNDMLEKFKKYSHLELEEKEIIKGMYYWVNEDGDLRLK